MTTPTRAAAGDDLILCALVAGWATLQALATLAVALVALLLTATRWRPGEPSCGARPTGGAATAPPCPLSATMSRCG